MSEKITIWGREFKLDVNYEIIDDDKITDKQKNTRIEFCKNIPDELINPNKIKDYCLKKDGEEIGNCIDNIFKYVIPQELFIGEDRVSVMCNYKFDMEHGIAIIFENNSFKKICSQDDIF